MPLVFMLLIVWSFQKPRFLPGIIVCKPFKKFVFEFYKLFFLYCSSHFFHQVVEEPNIMNSSPALALSLLNKLRAFQ